MSGTYTEDSIKVESIELGRYAYIPKILRVIFVVLYAIGIAGYIFYLFNFSIHGWILNDFPFYFLLYLVFSSGVFIYLPALKRDKNRIPWYDYALSGLAFGIFAYFMLNGLKIQSTNWVPPRMTYDLVLACVVILLALESGRRLAGWPLALICLLFGIYPIFADQMPGILNGFSFPFDEVVSSFAYSAQGMLGLPVQVVGRILLAFLILAGVLIVSGAGTFFLNLAMSLFGRYRGGPAKVAVIASGFFGSLSGSTTANIVGTGSVTIPTMKRLGYPPHYAAAIEAAASTGGVIMPPVMGTIAFVMAILTDIPYAEIVIAAVIPALLYYWGLLVQVDAYAARAGLKGLQASELPSLWKTLKQGWIYLITLGFLVFGLIYMRWSAQAAIYSSGLLFILSFTRRETMMTPRKIVEVITTVGRLILFLMAVLMPVGLIMIGLDLTGSMAALTTQIMSYAGTNTLMILLIAAAVSYIFGMIGLAFIPYIAFAVTALPALVSATGMSLLGLHFFVVIYLLMSSITPPVAYSAFVASAVAGSSPMKTAWKSMRLGIVLVFIPFFFVFNPALILQGSPLETVYLFILCLIGIWILASGLEGYLHKVGRLSLWSRPILIIGGFLIALPGWIETIIGAVITATIIAILVFAKRYKGAIRQKFT